MENALSLTRGALTVTWTCKDRHKNVIHIRYNNPLAFFGAWYGQICQSGHIWVKKNV